MKIRTQDESVILLRELDNDIFGAQDDSFTSIAAASAGEYYVSEESSLDDAPAARRVDLDASLVERGSDDNEMVVITCELLNWFAAVVAVIRKETGKRAYIQADRQTKRQTDRQAGRQHYRGREKERER